MVLHHTLPLPPATTRPDNKHYRNKQTKITITKVINAVLNTHSNTNTTNHLTHFHPIPSKMPYLSWCRCARRLVCLQQPYLARTKSQEGERGFTMILTLARRYEKYTLFFFSIIAFNTSYIHTLYMPCLIYGALWPCMCDLSA